MHTPETLREVLRDLPEPALSAALWPRLLEQRRRQVRRRRALAGAASTAVAVMLVAILALPGQYPPAATPTAQAPPDPPVAAQVRALDHALQVAYDRGASDSEVAPLWEARQALLVGNDDLRDGPSNPNDI